MLVQQLHPWLWLHLELRLQQVPPTTNQKLLHRNYCGSTEIRAMLLTNQLQYFEMVDS